MLRNAILRNNRSLNLALGQRCISSLVQSKGFINGSWVDSSNKEVFAVTNPANGQHIGNVPNMTLDDVKKAITSANTAFYSPEWAGLSALQRSNLLKSWFSLLQKNGDEIAKIMTAESGKPLNEAKGEVKYGNSFIEWFAEEARRINGEIVPSPLADREILILKQPIGVAALITPWNFPLAMITRKAGAALAAGCTLVIKPAEDTPLTALAAVKLAEEAGFPKGVINIITTNKAAPVGDLFCSSPEVRGISFTGSTEVGKLLFKSSADGVKKVSLELGGNAPFIVFDSASVDRAVDGALAAKFRNCGQTCVSPNRFFIQNGIYDKFIGKLKAKVASLKIGPGNEDGVQIGPLINKMQFGKVSSFVEDARSNKANVVQGGKSRSDIGDLFFEPTIVTDIAPGMKLYTEEVFGPVISVIRFNNEEEVLKMANDTRRGLAGYFYSNDVQQIFRVARKLQTGMVGINESLISTTEAPFGGVKESGVGREGSHYGIDEYTDIKYLCLGNMKY